MEIGTKVGYLTTIEEPVLRNNKGKPQYSVKCKCDCGNNFTLGVQALKNRKKLSCGCKTMKCLRHGLKNKYPHEYELWKRINKYNNICEEWYRDFPKFLEWIQNNGYIDDYNIVLVRKNNDLPFSPGNCEFITRQELVNRLDMSQARERAKKTMFERYGVYNASQLTGIQILYEEIPMKFWNSVLKGAERKGRKVDVTVEYLWDLFIQQDRKCALTGIELTFKNHYSKEQTASIDRIDSKQEYIPGNVQWVHKKVNKIKTDLEQKEFIEWCQKVASYQNLKLS